MGIKLWQKKILVSEDSASTRKIIADTLSGAGYDVADKSSGDLALQYVKAGWVPDLLITDINMPGIDGLTLIREVKQLPGCGFLRCILLTTESGDDRKQQGKEAGATAWITKPFDPDALLNVVGKVLR